jgi:hypothetical protein
MPAPLDSDWIDDIGECFARKNGPIDIDDEMPETSWIELGNVQISNVAF